jgi:hypothetical protein
MANFSARAQFLWALVEFSQGNFSGALITQGGSYHGHPPGLMMGDVGLQAKRGCLRCLEQTDRVDGLLYYRSFAYSALASFRMGMSGSGSFQSAKKT